MTPSVPEELAALEHKQWAHWTAHLLDTLCRRYSLPADDPEIRRWRRQIPTPYADLSEQEKASDRVWARQALAAMVAPLEAYLNAEYQECSIRLNDPDLPNPQWWLGRRGMIEDLVARLHPCGVRIDLMRCIQKRDSGAGVRD